VSNAVKNALEQAFETRVAKHNWRTR
jgi:hypothetical protein